MMGDYIMQNYMNTNLSADQRASLLLSEMSLDEKMAQVTCYYIRQDDDYQTYRKEYHHGVGEVSALEFRNKFNLKDDVETQIQVQKMVMASSEHHIPAIFHMEGLSGAYLAGASSFQSGIGRGSTWNPELEEKVGEIIGRQERSVGITHTLAPVLDVSRDPRMGREGEAYSEDPTLVSAMGTAMVKGIQGETKDGIKTEAVAKHFASSQATMGGIHGAENDLSQRIVEEMYVKPFQAAITEGGLMGIMPCYASVNGEPVSVSRNMLHELLRKRMGFNGTTVSDYCAISNAHNVQHVEDSDAAAGLRAMHAGMDVEMHMVQCFNDELCNWFRTGKADIEILNQAVLDVLKSKFRMGLFENPFSMTGNQLQNSFYGMNDDKVSLQSARESLILLKNDGVLPLNSSVTKIAVVGPHANTARAFFSGYTHFSMMEGNMAVLSSMAGMNDNQEKILVNHYPGSKTERDQVQFEAAFKKLNPQVPSLIEELQARMASNYKVRYVDAYDVTGNDHTRFERALSELKNYDLIILTLGGKYSTASIATTGEGVDSSDINLPKVQDDFIDSVSKLHIPLVGIHFDGRPISSDIADEKLNGLIEAWNPAEFGAKAIVDVLLGTYNPGGKLPVTVARSAGQIPIIYNHLYGSSYNQGESVGFPDYVDISHKPRYYFGFGLSYTNFKFSQMSLSDEQIAPDTTFTVSVNVENTGKVPGDEVVQLYMSDKFAQMSRPTQELVGFKRVNLSAGQSKVVTFTVDPSQFAYLDSDMRWLIEQGEIELMIGNSSDCLPLKKSIQILQNKHVTDQTRKFYAKGCVHGNE